MLTQSSLIAVLAQYTQHASNQSNNGIAGTGFIGGMNLDPIYWVLIGITMLASWGVGAMLKHKFNKFSQTPFSLSGREVALKMLAANGITDVQVISTAGRLTDHYNPADRTVNLSEAVYDNYSVAAAAVAAHECGHALQHAQAYAWLGLRSKLVPLVNICSTLSQWIIIIGIMMAAAGSNPWVFFVGIVMFAVTTLFAFVTLPVERDASMRALAWIRKDSTMNYMGREQAESALFWAGMTYVVAALSSLAMLLYYVLRFLNATRR